eukprot:GSMAST32.ASY1.ANO1.2829.1 assembled CDS
MEAFAHYSYHISDGELLICDLQGRYRKDTRKASRCRFELTDPAICSRDRLYGPTDLGEKGIDSFFANHQCNQFCSHFNGNWTKPMNCEEWFPKSSCTSMFSSRLTSALSLQNRQTFVSSMMSLNEIDEEDESSADSSW